MNEKILIILLFLVSFLFIFLIPFQGEFGLNDDPHYTKAVKDFVFNGKYFPENYSSILILQILYGSVFVKLFGFSNSILRVSIMFLSLFVPLLFYSISRVLGFTQKHSFLFGLVLLVNPFFVVLGHSFMTDVPFLFLILSSLLLLVYWIKENNEYAFLFGCTVLFFSFFLKQWSILFFIGLGLYVFLFSKNNTEKMIMVLFVVFFLFALFWSLPHYALADEGTYFKFTGKYVLPVLFGFPFYVSWFLFPLLFTLMLFTENLKDFFRNKLKFVFSVVFSFSGIIVGLVFFNRWFPYFANIINSFGLAPKMLVGEPTSILPGSFWILMTLLTTVSLVFLVNSFKLKVFQKKEYLFLLCFIVPYFFQLLFIGFFLDRYLFLILPVGFLLVFQQLKDKKFFSVGLVLTVLLFGVFSFVFTSEYISWNQTSWSLIDELKEQGVPLNEIDGGYEYCLSSFGQNGTQTMLSSTVIDRGVCGKSCSEPGFYVSFKPLDGCSVVKSESYFVFGLKFGEIYVNRSD